MGSNWPTYIRRVITYVFYVCLFALCIIFQCELWIHAYIRTYVCIELADYIRTCVCTLYVHFQGCHGTKWLENRCNSVRTHRASLGLTPCATHTLLNVSFSSSLQEARHVSLLRSARGSARSPLTLMNLTLRSSGCSAMAGIAA